jgi:hypothetical protein
MTLRTPAVWALALSLSLGAAGIARSAGPVSPAHTDPSAILEVSVDRSGLTVDVRNVPLARVLRAVGEQAGVDVSIRGDLNALVTESFHRWPLEEGIRRLARGHSLVVTYAAPEGDGQSRVLTRIWVMGDSSTPAAAATGSAREPASRATSPATRDPGEARADERVTGWMGGMQALTDEAGRGREAAVAVLTDLSTSEPDAAVRHQAVAALGRLTGPAIEPALTAALADADASIRARAVRGLRGTGTETAVQSLADAAIADEDAGVRLAALRALASYPGPAMREAFAKALSDPDQLVRETAIRGLSWWNTHRPGTP